MTTNFYEFNEKLRSYPIDKINDDGMDNNCAESKTDIIQVIDVNADKVDSKISTINIANESIDKNIKRDNIIVENINNNLVIDKQVESQKYNVHRVNTKSKNETEVNFINIQTKKSKNTRTDVYIDDFPTVDRNFKRTKFNDIPSTSKQCKCDNTSSPNMNITSPKQFTSTDISAEDAIKLAECKEKTLRVALTPTEDIVVNRLSRSGFKIGMYLMYGFTI